MRQTHALFCNAFWKYIIPDIFLGLSVGQVIVDLREEKNRNMAAFAHF